MGTSVSIAEPVHTKSPISANFQKYIVSEINSVQTLMFDFVHFCFSSTYDSLCRCDELSTLAENPDEPMKLMMFFTSVDFHGFYFELKTLLKSIK